MNSRKFDGNNFAIIGASGTGKTTLAVGLYATSTESFTVAPAGDETRKYLEIRKTSIEEGFWPAATNESENFDLRLRLHASGRQTDIVFREYMGERMERDPNYIREVIGTPKSAIILFNPGMPGLSKPETRNRMLGNLKVIAQHLKVNGCIAVAFVVTASDRLTSDLAEFCEVFEAYASEVTNYLTNLGLDWKRFEVTVSGQLDDQNKPKLARGENNTTHEPFLWLLKRIRDSKRRRRLRMFATVVAAFIGVSGALLGGLVVHSRQVLTKAEKAFANTTNALNIAYAAHDEAKVRTTLEFLTTNSFDKVTAILPSDQARRNELVKRVNEQSDLWRVRLLKMEFDSNKSKVNTKPLDVQLEWFGGFDKKLITLSPSSKDAVIERDMLTNDWDNSRIELETKCQTAHFRNVVDQERKNLASAKPDAIIEPLRKSKTLIADAVTYALVTNRAELCNSLGLIMARTNAIAKYVDSKVRRPDDDKRPDDTEKLRQSVSKDLKTALTTEEFDDLSKIISERNDVALKAWDAYHFSKRVKELEIALNAAGSNPSHSLTDSLSFLSTMTNSYPSISQLEFIKARNAIEAARKQTLIAYASSIACKWNVNGSRLPEYDAGGIRTAILTEVAVTDEEYKFFSSGMNARFEKVRQAWDTKQKTLVDEFVIDGDIEAVIRNYGGFCDDWPNNPYLDKLNRKIESRLIEFFRGYISEYCSEFFGKDCVGNAEYPKSRMEKAQMRFNKFKGVCLAITGRGLSSTPLPKTNVGRFAADCVNYGNLQDAGITTAFWQEFKITEIAVKFSPSSLDSTFKRLVIGCSLQAERWNFSLGCKEKLDDIDLFSESLYKSACNGGWYRLWAGNVTIRANPWTFTSFRISYGDKTGAFMVDKSDSTRWWLYFEEGRNSPECSTNIRLVHGGWRNKDTAGELSIRITFSGKGTDLINLWKRSMQ